jgi:hypothetical protein
MPLSYSCGDPEADAMRFLAGGHSWELASTTERGMEQTVRVDGSGGFLGRGQLSWKHGWAGVKQVERG